MLGQQENFSKLPLFLQYIYYLSLMNVIFAILVYNILVNRGGCFLLMINSFDSLLRTTRLVCTVLLLISIFILVSVLASTPEKSTVHASESQTFSYQQAPLSTNSPNVVANTVSLIGHHANQTIDMLTITTQQATNRMASGAKSGILATVDKIQNSTAIAVRGAGTGLAYAGRGIGSGISFLILTPGRALGAVSNVPIVSSFVRPAYHAEDIPMIDPNSPELQAALVALPAQENAKEQSTQVSGNPQWPVHGQITTHFGVSHWPFQHTHTGMDISDGSAPGTTSVKPFRPGTVTETNHSPNGLGNHVIVDHGSGVTSVYAHLNSIAVQIGQKVTLDSTLGMQGTTGVSTGTHLHFEIRVNGKAADPRQFINGRP